MGQSAWLNTSCPTLQGITGRVNGTNSGPRTKPLIPCNLIILKEQGARQIRHQSNRPSNKEGSGQRS